MVEDKQLIRQYAVERSEAAFAELVRRHLKMVYAAALRQVNGDTHLAEDVAQTVFADFARKAKTLQHNGSIAGWLFVSTRFAAANAVRTESRRRAREQEVVAMNEINPNGNDGWNELRPLIDEALAELGETDRESIVLRYFQGYEFSLVGTALGVSENAARMRVDRALDKLRVVLQRRGLATTAAALGAALADSTGAAVPAQLAAMITSAALAQVVPSASVGTPSILKLMTMNKIAGITLGLAAASLAVALVVHSSSVHETSRPAAQTSAVAKIHANPGGGPGSLADSTSVAADAYHKVVEGHDSQMHGGAQQGAATNNPRAEWDNMVAACQAELKSDPEVHGGSVYYSLVSGVPLLMSGWRMPDGRNALFFVNPLINQNGAGTDQVLLSAKLVEVPDGVLDRAGFGNLKATPTKWQQGLIPDNNVDAMMATLSANATDTEKINVITAPQVLTKIGQMAALSVGNQEDVDGTQKFIGTRLFCFPNQPDSGPPMLEMFLLYRPDGTGHAASPSNQ